MTKRSLAMLVVLAACAAPEPPPPQPTAPDPAQLHQALAEAMDQMLASPPPNAVVTPGPRKVFTEEEKLQILRDQGVIFKGKNPETGRWRVVLPAHMIPPPSNTASDSTR